VRVIGRTGEAAAGGALQLYGDGTIVVAQQQARSGVPAPQQASACWLLQLPGLTRPALVPQTSDDAERLASPYPCASRHPCAPATWPCSRWLRIQSL
jgi:hypothetical protein